MNISKLKEHLIENPSYVEDILEAIFHNVKYYDSKNQWYMSWDENDTSNHIRLRSDTLNYKDYKYNESGDIFTLFINRLKINLGKCLDLVANKSCFLGEKMQDRVLAFGGYFKKLQKSTSIDQVVYNSEEIEKYPENISKLFLKDNISIETQRKFNIRYDVLSDRVIIPCYREGKLIGAVGRYNLQSTGNVAKYLPILTYNKSKYLFGVDINYSNLYGKTIIVIESEKSVMKAYTLGVKNVIAIGGNYISDFHKELLYQLKPKEIIVMFDKGLDKKRIQELDIDLTKGLESAIIDRTKVLKSKNCYYNPRISYINLNEFKELSDGDNIFDYDNLDYQYYIDRRKKLNG